MEIYYSRFDVIFRLGCHAGLSCSTLYIGPRTYILSLVFLKLVVVKGVKKNLVKFSLHLCIIKVVGNIKDLNDLSDI